jgi:hypothetical protein
MSGLFGLDGVSGMRKNFLFQFEFMPNAVGGEHGDAVVGEGIIDELLSELSKNLA